MTAALKHAIYAWMTVAASKSSAIAVRPEFQEGSLNLMSFIAVRIQMNPEKSQKVWNLVGTQCDVFCKFYRNPCIDNSHGGAHEVVR
jgi:hypothetical protein